MTESTFPDGACSTVVNFATINPTDHCPTEVTFNPVSGTEFPLGDTTVTVVATDSSGNTDEEDCTFTVTIEDNEVSHVLKSCLLVCFLKNWMKVFAWL